MVKTKWLECKLTEQEVRERSDSLAQAVVDLADVQDEKKRTAADLSSREKTLAAQARKLSDAIRTRAEFRDVEIEEKYDSEIGRNVYVRKDTGAMLPDAVMQTSMGL